MRPYVIHYATLTNPPHIVCVEVESDNVISVVGKFCSERGVKLDQIVAVNEKSFMIRVVSFIQAKTGGNDASIYPNTLL